MLVGFSLLLSASFRERRSNAWGFYRRSSRCPFKSLLGFSGKKRTSEPLSTKHVSRKKVVKWRYIATWGCIHRAKDGTGAMSPFVFTFQNVNCFKWSKLFSRLQEGWIGPTFSKWTSDKTRQITIKHNEVTLLFAFNASCRIRYIDAVLTMVCSMHQEHQTANTTGGRQTMRISSSAFHHHAAVRLCPNLSEHVQQKSRGKVGKHRHLPRLLLLDHLFLYQVMFKHFLPSFCLHIW